MQCSPASVGLAQAHPNKSISKNQNKTKQNGKKKMRTKFKLCYKEGFKLSGSTSFELQVRNNTYLHTTPACQHPTRHMIGRHAPFCSFRSPGRECSQSPAATLLHIHWYHSLSNLTVSLFCHWRGKLCHVCSILKWLAVLFERRKAKALASF